jgi:hypothetical protein
MFKLSTRRALLLFVLTSAGTLGIDCSSSKKVSVGQVTMALTLPSGAVVGSVHWTISSTSIATIAEGGIATWDEHATASVFTSYPASTGDTVTLHALTSTGRSCDGTSSTFSVTAGAVAMVGVVLTCEDTTPTQTQGSVDVNGIIGDDNCPLLTSWVASPLQTSAYLGEIDVNGTATDADAADVLTYAWTATSGSFANPSSAMTQFHCAPGPSAPTLTLTVSDNHSPFSCTTKIDVPVTCVYTGFCGDGFVDPSLGEQCDPPDGRFCDANCHYCTAGEPGCCLGEFCPPPMDSGVGGRGGSLDTPPCAMCQQGGVDDGTCFNTSVDGVSNGCIGFTGAQQTACQGLLVCLRSGNGSGHTCGRGDDPTPCLCGAIPYSVCGQTDPTTLPGVCVPQYIAANGGTGTGFFGNFFSNTSPVGIANNEFQCDVDLASDTSVSCPLSTCGVLP